MKILKGDYVIAVCALVFAFLLFLYFVFWEEAKKALIYVDGDLYAEVSLLKDGEIDVKDRAGNMLMTAEVKDGSVFVARSNCKNHACVKMGKINRATETIICLPNKVLIKADDGKNSKDTFDGIAG